MIAMAQKDPQIVQQAARNVLLLDAVIRSAENIDAMHSKQLEGAALVSLVYIVERHSKYLIVHW